MADLTPNPLTDAERVALKALHDLRDVGPLLIAVETLLAAARADERERVTRAVHDLQTGERDGLEFVYLDDLRAALAQPADTEGA